MSMKPKALCLVSGGIDSPLAAYLASRKYKIIPIHFCHYPYYCKGSFETMIKVMKKLKEKTKFRKLIIFPYAEILSVIMKGTDKRERKYICVLCRKGMLKATEKICEKEEIEVIITGESLAQKASQTLLNILATHKDIETPILHPLFCLDKEEIVNKAKKHGLYFEQHVGCCNVAPDLPVTKADVELTDRLFDRLGLEEIIEKNMEKILEIKKFDDSGLILRKFLK